METTIKSNGLVIDLKEYEVSIKQKDNKLHIQLSKIEEGENEAVQEGR